MLGGNRDRDDYCRGAQAIATSVYSTMHIAESVV